MFGLEDVQTARSCATPDFYCEWAVFNLFLALSVPILGPCPLLWHLSWDLSETTRIPRKNTRDKRRTHIPYFMIGAFVNQCCCFHSIFWNVQVSNCWHSTGELKTTLEICVSLKSPQRPHISNQRGGSELKNVARIFKGGKKKHRKLIYFWRKDTRKTEQFLEGCVWLKGRDSRSQVAHYSCGLYLGANPLISGCGWLSGATCSS